MSRSFNVQGGSASDCVAEAGGGGIAGLFQPGVKAFQPGSKDRDVYFRILPAFDFTMSPADSAFPSTWAEYRLRDGQRDSETRTEAFSAWYLQVIAYTYLGNTKTGILSPLTLKAMGNVSMEECADPIYDMQQKARHSERPDWKALAFAENDADRRELALPFQPVHVLFNAQWTVANKGWDQGVGIIKTTGLKHLKQQLCWPSTIACPAIDPHWPDYLLGDVTNPNSGLKARVFKSQVGTVETYCLHFTREDFKSIGVEVHPLTAEAMVRRHLLGSDKTLRLMTYQEIVDWAVFDGFVPRDLIREACGARANVPAGEAVRFDSQSTSLPPAGQQAPLALPPAGGSHTAPQQQPQYAAPQQNFGPPAQQQPQYAAPQQQPQYAAPQQNFGPPAQQQPQYAAPQQNFGPPAGGPGAPSMGMLPMEAYKAPAAGLDPNKMYQVRQGGNVSEGTGSQVKAWWDSLAQKVPSDIRPSSLEHDWRPIEDLLNPQQALVQQAIAQQAPAQQQFSQPGFQQPQAPVHGPAQYPGAPVQTQMPAASQAFQAAPNYAGGMAPQGYPPVDNDGIPGLPYANGGPPPQAGHPGVAGIPVVAQSTDPQPQPAGAPMAGGFAAQAGPLSPEERAQYEALRQKDPSTMTAREVQMYSALSPRARLG